MFLFYFKNIKTIWFKDVQLQLQQKYGLNNASYSSKKSTHHVKRSPVEDNNIEIVGINTAIAENS